MSGHYPAYPSPTKKSGRKPNLKNPWWMAVDLPVFSSRFDESWPALGLQVQTLFGAPPLLEKVHKACMKEGEKIEALHKRFTESFPELRIVHDDRALNKRREIEKKWVTPTSFVRMHFDGDSKLETSIVTVDEELLTLLLEWLGKNTTRVLPRGRVHVLAVNDQGPYFLNMGVGGQVLERSNYEEKVLRGYDRIIRDLRSPEPSGRVSILNGEPGTGKTYLIRGLIDEVPDVTVAIIQANLVSKLAEPSILPSLLNLHRDNGERPIVFIIEDADDVLAPRMADNISAVSTILNLGDGILGKLLDIRIVCTTNQVKTEIDDAIRRPGRLSAEVHVGSLDRTPAECIYRRLTGKSFTAAVPNGFKATLAEVYQMARADGWEPPPPKKKVGFQPENEDEEYYGPPVKY